MMPDGWRTFWLLETQISLRQRKSIWLPTASHGRNLTMMV